MRKWIIAIAAVIVFVAAVGAAYFVLFTLPYNNAVTSMPQSGAKITRSDNGSLTLTWPEAENADDYLVEFQIGDDSFWTTRRENSCVMPDTLVGDGKVTVTITPRREYKTLTGTSMRPCETPLVATYPAALPTLDSLSTVLDPDADTLTLTWDPVDGGVYTVFDEDGKELVRTSKGEAVITFGEDVPMPAKDETVTFTMKCALNGFDVEYLSNEIESIRTEGESLRGTKLLMELEELGNNRYKISWNETKGERYELQLRAPSGQWETVGTFTDGQELSCVLGPLAPFSQFEARVTAYGKTPLPGSEFTASPSEASFTTGPSVIYSTVWVMDDLTVWSDPEKTEKVGTASTNRSYCVIDEVNGFFLIYIDGAKGYIDSNYCLINLPDYLGDLVEYDITNSYDSAYMVHDYGIPKMTNTVIPGYEEVAFGTRTVVETRTVRQDVDENGNHIDLPPWADLYSSQMVNVEKPLEFLVPLLYPTAQKVLQAALAAREDGYKLKIYDAFRPGSATRFLYDLAEGLLKNEIPEHEYSEMAGDMWRDYYYSLYPEEMPSVAAEGGGDDAAVSQNGDATQSENGSETTPGDEEGDPTQPGTDSPSEGDAPSEGNDEPGNTRPSYFDLMTDEGRYKLGNFLARSGSYHNYGLAVDLTLVDIKTGEELTMQTAIHDLSWYSVLSNNNANADLLARYMTGANLTPLVSEWWHFQDNDTDSKVSGIPQRWNGVTRAGWTADTTGWRYRTGEGDYLKDGTFEVNGASYTFDAEGYADYTAWENN